MGLPRGTTARLAAAAALALLCCAAGVAHAAPRRFAVIVGQAVGLPGDERLRFAETDAQRVAAVLRELGGFAAEDIVVLTRSKAAELRRALITVNARLREVPGETVLFVFYSGHADAEALHLAGTALAADELRDLVAGSSATARVLVIDACRSGGATRRKGGQRAAAFAIDVQDRLQSRGVAILHSSAEGEDSQESDRLAASFFTHYLVSALRGAADADGDGRVTLSEAFSFAAERTLSATARTVAGPQHPTYRFDLAGREDLVLTAPALAGASGGLAFAEPGSYLVQGKDATGPLVAEIEVDDRPRALALPDGEYLVTRRAPSFLLQGRFAVRAAVATAVRGASMERIAYAQVVRKGGTRLTRSWSAFASAGARGAHSELEAGAQLSAGVRVDLPRLSLEARLFAAWADGAARASSSPDKRVQRGGELGARLLALRGQDLGRTTLSAGLQLGALLAREQQGSDETIGAPRRPALLLGGVVQAQRPLFGRFYLRAELGGAAYVFSATDSSPAPRPGTTSWLWQAELGAGAYF